jgi:zinc protease
MSNSKFSRFSQVSKHRKSRLLSAAALLSCSLTALAQPATQPGGTQTSPTVVPAAVPSVPSAFKLSDRIPVGPQVKVGKLDNGLTYYIQKNGKPEKKLELRLVVKAGSILEDDDQQGLAHFTEHMAFNGSTHFKKSELISYLQSIGIKFGADLNAYTSFDQTVYILPIPTEDRKNIDQGFSVLQDWAQGLTLEDSAIDAERAVVLEELRIGKGADDRMRKVLFPKLFNGSRYADRLPIGKEHILQTFKHDALRRFYHDWYRPDLMAVVVVGDIEPAEAEKLIRAHFSGLKNPAHERPRPYAQIPLRAATEGLVVTDKEATSNSLLIRYPIQEVKDVDTFGYYRQSLIEGLYGGMLGQRMQELTLQANPPFIQGGSGADKVARGYKSYTARAVLGKAGVQPAIDALVQEDERARQFGFGAQELERAKKNLLRSFERAYSERDKSDSAGYVAEYTRNFLEQESIAGIANEYAYVQKMVPGITLEEVNQAFKQAIPPEQKKLVVYMGSDQPAAGNAGQGLPTKESLVAAVSAAEKVVVQPRQEKTYGDSLMASPPKAGSVVTETVDKALGLIRLTLSNGVNVVLKPTDFKNDQVLLSSTRFGGQSLFDDADIFNARYASSIVGQMGLSTYSPTDLQKVLAGKSVNVGAYLGNLSEGVSASSGSNDIETMLQLVYLSYTGARQDGAIYQSFISKQQDLAKNALSRPETLLNDTVLSTVYNDSPRIARVARPSDFDKVHLDRVMQIYRDRFSSARGTTFFLVGSFDPEKVKPLLATYLASLPAGETVTSYRDLGVRPVAGVVKKDVFKGAEPKSSISLTFNGAAHYSEAEQMKLQALVEVLNIKLVEVLREKMGLIYGGGMQAALSPQPYENYSISVSFPTGPQNVDKVIAATFAEIEKIKAEGPQAADLAKVKLNWITNYQKAMRDNGFWLSRLQASQVLGTDPASILTYEKRVASIGAEDVKEAARRYFDMQNYVQVVLYPEAAAAKLAKQAP